MIRTPLEAYLHVFGCCLPPRFEAIKACCELTVSLVVVIWLATDLQLVDVGLYLVDRPFGVRDLLAGEVDGLLGGFRRLVLGQHDSRA